MITIKDVAKKANVSVGTVSNVINGKTKNLELIDKVEAAIKELGFIPDSKAKNLKSAKTNIVGLIFDNKIDSQARSIIEEITSFFSARGYDVIVNTTDGNAILEEKSIQHFLQMGVDGIIVNTTCGKKKWYEKFRNKIPIVFLEKTPTIHSDMDVIKINYEPAALEFEQWCQKNKKVHVGFIIENSQASLVNEDAAAFRKSVKLVGESFTEWGFKQTYELLCEDPEIDTVVIGNYSLAKGARKAIELLGRSTIDLVCVKNRNWLEDSGIFSGVIHISTIAAGGMAAENLIKKIENRLGSSNHLQTLDAKFLDIGKLDKVQWENWSAEKLTVAVLSSEIIQAMKNISKIYEKMTGLKIEFVAYKYKELAELLSNEEQLSNSGIDVIMYDFLWKHAIKKNILAKIDVPEEENYVQSFINQAVENYGEFQQELRGLPLLGGTQLLIYQKDIFEDASIRRQFELSRGYELAAPRTWEEYRQIAEFFTKKFNPKSPTEYGVSLINEGNIYNSIEFFNRLASYSVLQSPEEILARDRHAVELAVGEYLKAFEYTDTSQSTANWGDVANAFKKGKVAMVILYDSFVYGINDSIQSNVAGNIGSAQIPGGKSILGGWGIGVSAHSKKKEIGKNFITWLCSPQAAHLFSILTGSSIHQEFYQNKELDMIYPWKKEVLASYQHSQLRNLNQKFAMPSEVVTYYDESIGKILGNLIRGESDIETTVKKIGM